MGEPAPSLEDLRHELSPQWSAERSARLYAATVQLRRTRDARRVVAYTAAAFTAAAVLAAGLQGIRLRDLQAALGSPPANPAAAGHTLRLADGSRAELRGEKSEIEAVEDSPERIVLKLIAGRAHFDVVPNPERTFVVEAPPYRVQVIGTIFDVDRSAGAVRVHVARGHVRVDGPEGRVDLRAGEGRRFEQTAVEPIPRMQVHREVASIRDAGATAEPSAERSAPTREARTRTRTRAIAHATPTSRTVPRRSDADALQHAGDTESMPSPAQAQEPPDSATESWRSLSRSGQYEAAFESLRRSEPVAEDPAALMDAADTARLSGHASSAVQYLRRVARDHRKSPVAPLAAFTLGRVYLEELGQPDLAAEAFELSRKLAPAGSMAQDALAREVEALSKAGNARKAYVRAREYLQRYPGGRRVRAVQLYGGIE
jgi:transmembrane sensor